MATGKYVLLKYEGSWADEMDIAGFLVVAHEYWAERKAALTALKGEIELCLGTNEEIRWDCGADLVEEIGEVAISDEKAALLQKLFPSSYGYGEGDSRRYVIAEYGQTGFLENRYSPGLA